MYDTVISLIIIENFKFSAHRVQLTFDKFHFAPLSVALVTAGTMPGIAAGTYAMRFVSQQALRRAFALFKRKAEWQEVQRRAMAQAFDWNAAAAQYVAQYERVMA